MPRIPVTRDDWKCTPMSDLSTTVELDFPVSDDAMEMVRLGLKPEAMEDKWFLYFEEPHLHGHRSWTGLGAFRLTFAHREGGWRIVSARVSQDPEGINFATPEEGVRIALETVAVCLLGMVGGPEDTVLQRWGSYGRAILAEGPQPGKDPDEGAES